jgi:p-aminobenzoyl-glutamate transporter AbgT
MCCFFAVLLFFGPRLAFVIYWIFPAGHAKVDAAFNGSFLVALIGLLILPWMTLAYVIFYPLSGFDYVWVILGLIADIAGYTGGFRSRKQVPGYTGP